MPDLVRRTLLDSRNGLDALLQDAEILDRIERAGGILSETFASGNTVFSCGNGGSLCDALHFAEECTGRFRRDRPPLPATAIADPAHLSCTANDFGWNQVFSRYLRAHGKPGDLLVALSTSGRSENILEAAREARGREMRIVALTGTRGSALGALADIDIPTPSGPYSDHVQELHITVLHLLVQISERTLFPELY